MKWTWSLSRSMGLRPRVPVDPNRASLHGRLTVPADRIEPGAFTTGIRVGDLVEAYEPEDGCSWEAKILGFVDGRVELLLDWDSMWEPDDAAGLATDSPGRVENLPAPASPGAVLFTTVGPRRPEFLRYDVGFALSGAGARTLTRPLFTLPVIYPTLSSFLLINTSDFALTYPALGPEYGYALTTSITYDWPGSTATSTAYELQSTTSIPITFEGFDWISAVSEPPGRPRDENRASVFDGEKIAA